MGLIPEHKRTKLGQKALVLLSAVFYWIGGLLYCYWFERWWVGVAIVALITIILGLYVWGMFSWVNAP